MTLYVQQTQTFVMNNTDFKHKYRAVEELGHGCFGVVYKANIHYKDTEVDSIALKIMCGRTETESKLQELIRNITLCREMKCDNIVRYFDFHQYTHRDKSYSSKDSEDGEELRFLCIQLELCTGGDLRSSPFRKTHYSNDSFRREVMLGLLKGLEHIHALKHCHGDLHYGNILFQSTTNSTVKISDFGYVSDANIQKDIESFIEVVVHYLFGVRESESGKKEMDEVLKESKATPEMIKVLVGLKKKNINIKDSITCLENTNNGKGYSLFIYTQPL